VFFEDLKICTYSKNVQAEGTKRKILKFEALVNNKPSVEDMSPLETCGSERVTSYPSLRFMKHQTI
jgi:hypothetical protein